MEAVLYSCIGTTDPVRGMRDGGLMHILRFYRPETVYLFLSREMVERDRADDRIARTFAFLRENWAGYSPRLVRFETDIEDPSDMEAFIRCRIDAADALDEDHTLKEIQQFIRNPAGQVYIPGSSIKGALRTAVLKAILLKKSAQKSRSPAAF